MYYLASCIDIRQNLIDKELTQMRDDIQWEAIGQPSNCALDWLFRHFKVEEFSEMWYDSEPEIEETDTPEQVRQKVLDYQEQRLRFNNWIEPMGDGIWDMSQKDVDARAKQVLKEIRGWPVKKKGRLFFGRDADMLYIYWYGRDIEGLDYWWIMKRRNASAKL